MRARGTADERPGEGVISMVVPMALHAWHLHHGYAWPTARSAQDRPDAEARADRKD